MERLTEYQALDHPWVNQKCDCHYEKLPVEIVFRLQEYNDRCIFKDSLHEYIAVKLLEQQERENDENFFRELNLHEDEYLSLSDIKNVCITYFGRGFNEELIDQLL